MCQIKMMEAQAMMSREFYLHSLLSLVKTILSRLTTTQTDADSAANLDDQMEEEEEEENTSFVPKKRRHNQSNSTSREPRVQHNDTFNAFGLFIASQLRSLSKRNRIAAADLQRSIFEFCLKSELEN